MKIESIVFTDENGEEKEFYVECDARVAGRNYLLVTDSPDGDAEALILRDISEDGEAEARYVPVTEDAELAALMKVFEELLEDTDIEA
ncbi:MAG: DUF1292 domain-containing protein [Lachnospiraceae bacterium]|nr:DUF1292 domain-containing protein [Lachnospiraceae bacterium]